MYFTSSWKLSTVFLWKIIISWRYSLRFDRISILNRIDLKLSNTGHRVGTKLNVPLIFSSVLSSAALSRFCRQVLSPLLCLNVNRVEKRVKGVQRRTTHFWVVRFHSKMRCGREFFTPKRVEYCYQNYNFHSFQSGFPLKNMLSFILLLERVEIHTFTFREWVKEGILAPTFPWLHPCLRRSSLYVKIVKIIQISSRSSGGTRGGTMSKSVPPCPPLQQKGKIAENQPSPVRNSFYPSMLPHNFFLAHHWFQSVKVLLQFLNL